MSIKNNKIKKSNKNKNATREGTLIETKKHYQLIRLLPVVIVIAIVPLILRWFKIPLDYPVNRVWGSNAESDVYTYGKIIAIMIVTFASLILMFLTFKKETIKDDRLSKITYAATALLVMSLIISAVISDYKSIAIWGAPERHEGLIIHICYTILFFYTYTVIQSEEDFDYVKNAMIFLAIVMVIIGISQSIGKNIVNTDLVRRFIFPGDKINSLTKVETGKSVYLTLMNPNYVGSYASMAVLFLSAISLSSKENSRMRIISLLLIILTLFVLIKSGSQAGIVGIMAGLIVLLTVNIRNIAKHPKMLSLAVVLIILVTVGTDFVTKGALRDNVTRTVTDAASLFTDNQDYIHDPSFGFAVKDISTSDNIVEIDTQVGEINMIFTENGKLEFRDQNNNDILSVYDSEATTYLLKEPFSKFRFAVSKDSQEHHVQVGLQYDNAIYFIFEWFSGEGIQMINRNSNIYEWGAAKYIGFEGKEKVGSGRGYIWSRTLPLILEKPLLGYGPDTFIMNFPQNDMLAKIHVYNNVSMVTDKPHNMYLLYAINSGLIGLGAALVLWGTYVFSSLKTLLKAKSRSRVYYNSMGCLGAVSAYLATGMFNDSVPVIAPVFWVILGSGYALNYILRNEDVEVAKDEKQVI